MRACNVDEIYSKSWFHQHEPLSNESGLRSFSLITVWLCDFLSKKYWFKNWSKNVDEIDYRSLQFERDWCDAVQSWGSTLSWQKRRELLIYLHFITSFPHLQMRTANNSRPGVNFINVLRVFFSYEHHFYTYV